MKLHPWDKRLQSQECIFHYKTGTEKNCNVNFIWKYSEKNICFYVKSFYFCSANQLRVTRKAAASYSMEMRPSEPFLEMRIRTSFAGINIIFCSQCSLWYCRSLSIFDLDIYVKKQFHWKYNVFKEQNKFS